MGDILIRGLDKNTVKRLKDRAKRHGRSVQGEAKRILERAASLGPDEVAERLKAWKSRLRGKRFGDSAALIREDRER